MSNLPPPALSFARRCFESDDAGLPPKREAHDPPHAVALALAHEAARRYDPEAAGGGIAVALTKAWLCLEPEEAAVSMTATRLLALAKVAPALQDERADQMELALATALTVLPAGTTDAPHGRVLARMLFRTFTQQPDASPVERAHWQGVADLVSAPTSDAEHNLGAALAARRDRAAIVVEPGAATGRPAGP